MSLGIGSVKPYLGGAMGTKEHVWLDCSQFLQGNFPSHFRLRRRHKSQACNARDILWVFLCSVCRSVLLYSNASKPRFILARTKCAGNCKNDQGRFGSRCGCQIDQLRNVHDRKLRVCRAICRHIHASRHPRHAWR